MVVRLSDRFGGVDVLVNNAGVIQMGPIRSDDARRFEKAMNAHFWGPLNTMMAVLPGMRAAGRAGGSSTSRRSAER